MENVQFFQYKLYLWIIYYSIVIKMFPNLGFAPFFNTFETFPIQISPQVDFNNVYVPFGSNGYYQQLCSEFQLNNPFGQFSQFNFFPDLRNQSSESFQQEQLGQIQNKGMKKNDSSQTIDEKNIFEQKDKIKTKIISKNDKKSKKSSLNNCIKQRKNKVLIKQNESEYEAEEENKKKSQDQMHLFLKYRRKNTESNIVNRIYSFLTSEFKNRGEVVRFSLSDEKKESYIKYLVQVVEAWKGPVKRQLLQKLINVNEQLPGYKIITKLYESEKILSLEEFSYLNRVLIRTYLSKIAGISVITSKKMKRAVWKQHLQKIRELKQYFFCKTENKSQ